jgi:ribonuclease P protein component
MGSARAWRLSEAARCWPTAAPRAASVCRPDSGQALTAPGRLTRRAEFLRAAAKGRKAPMPGLVLQALRREDAGPARLGFTVTKKIGNAVIRNRTRRRLKEAARLVMAARPVAGVDLVLVGRAGTRGRPFTALQEDLRRALAKAGVA